MRIIIIASCIVALLLINSLAAQENTAKLTQQERSQIIDKIGNLLINNYIFREPAARCSDYLRSRFDSGAYSNLTHPRQFAEKLTGDILAILNDKHVRVENILPAEERLQKESPLMSLLLQSYQQQKSNRGIQEVKRLSGNIGYLNITSFEPLEGSQSMIDAAMHLLQQTDALIIDLRENTGGNPATVQYLCSYFFDQKILLNSFYWRRDNYTEEFWSLSDVSEKKFPKIPLFVLTSSRTFSAAEEFTYNLKTRQRALIIGEKTGGGANPGFTFSLNPRFAIFIPVGRAINPVTATNWEGVGVIPDIQIESAASLNLAMEKARQAGRIYREAADEAAVRHYTELIGQLDLAEKLFANNRPDSADALLTSALQSCLDNDLIEEGSINSLGYRYLDKKILPVAIAIFSFNVRHYPDSANAYDSLGEAYVLSEKKDLAIQNYRKSLELNPDNQNARFMLKKLGALTD